MASAKLTIGSLMGLITTTCNTATDSIDIVANSVAKIKAEQIIEHKADLTAHKVTYKATVAKETALFLQDIAQLRAADAEFASLYDQTMTLLDA